MEYLKKNKETGSYEEVENISSFKKNEFKKFDLFYISQITPEHFKEQLIQHRRHELLREIENKTKELRDLGGQAPAPAMHSMPSFPEVMSPIDAGGHVVPTTPMATRLRVKEAEEVYKQFQSDIASDNQGRFESVVTTENAGDHFIAVVTEKSQSIPKAFMGIPVVQISDEQYQQMM